MRRPEEGGLATGEGHSAEDAAGPEKQVATLLLHGFAESQVKYVTLCGPLFPCLLSSYRFQSQRSWASSAQGGREEGAGARGGNWVPDRHLETTQTWRDEGGVHMCLVL